MLARKVDETVGHSEYTQSDALKDILAGTRDAVEIGKMLPEMQRARIAQFCYNRVHMRELGLRLASTCEMVSLKNAFGRAADVVYAQSRNVDGTLSALKNAPGHQAPRPVTLKHALAQK